MGHQCGTCGREGGHAAWCEVTGDDGSSNDRCACERCVERREAAA
jgi:hypothetical protein